MWLVFHIVCTVSYSYFYIKTHISVLQVFCLIGYVPSVILFTYITSFTFKKIVNTKEFWSFIYSVVSHILYYFVSAFPSPLFASHALSSWLYWKGCCVSAELSQPAASVSVCVHLQPRPLHEGMLCRFRVQSLASQQHLLACVCVFSPVHSTKGWYFVAFNN